MTTRRSVDLDVSELEAETPLPANVRGLPLIVASGAIEIEKAVARHARRRRRRP